MDFNDNAIEFPLDERIGHPRLYVERSDLRTEFDQWVARIPKKLSKSMALLARKKSGKTAFIERLFNRLWSDNGAVVPFYLEVSAERIWYPQFALKYYRTFASQYISFLERDPRLVLKPLSLEKIKAYGQEKNIDSFVEDVDELNKDLALGNHGLMWETAFQAPHQFAGIYNRPIAVLIDEFQNMSGYVCVDEALTNIHFTLPGSYHEHSESKIAPMLVTGSAVGWLENVIDTYLEAGRLSKRWFSTYLTPEEGLTAVYRYSEAYEEPITNETALLINQLTNSDPYFISCVFRSSAPSKNLQTKDGVLHTVQYETTDAEAEMAGGWIIYFNRVLDTVNQRYAKLILLYLSLRPGQQFSPLEIKQKMKLDLSVKEVHDRLEKLYAGDLIRRNFGGFTYMGLKDGTFYLVIQERLRQEMGELGEVLKTLNYRHTKLLNQKLKGALNSQLGYTAELQLMCDMQMRGSFPFSTYFKGIADDETFTLAAIHSRHMVQTPLGKKRELDIRADGRDKRSLLVEVKKTTAKTGTPAIKSFLTTIDLFRNQNPKRQVVPAFFSLAGFTKPALTLCAEKGIGVAESLNHYQTEWS